MTTERKVTALLDDKTLWAVYRATAAVAARAEWPRNIDAPYWYVLGASSWAWELDQQAWVEDVKQRLGLIACDDDEEARATRLELARETNPWPDLSGSPWLATALRAMIVTQ